MSTFRRLLVNSLIAGVTTNFLWFAITFWAYLETRSVLATSIIGGSFMLLSALCGLVFGGFVDRHRKKRVMLISSCISLVSFGAAGALFVLSPEGSILVLSSMRFWGFVLMVLSGAAAGNLRMIALSTCVTLLVPEPEHAGANGLIGTVNGTAFALTSVFSGLVVGRLGMMWALGLSVGLTAVVILDLFTVDMEEAPPVREAGGRPPLIDVKGAATAVQAVPGLLGLIFFTTFNNFLGGVFMALADPYGLELVSVESWGIIWGVLSLGYILGGMAVARRGLGESPLRVLFLVNIVLWSVTVLFPIHSSIVPLIIGFFVYMVLLPVVEASEQTIIQRVVPFEVQGRVFGFAQAVESAASPITAFLIGPAAQIWIIPFMTEGSGARTIGAWFGTGVVRALALVFILAGLIGLVVTLLAMRSGAYRMLSAHYARGAGEMSG